VTAKIQEPRTNDAFSLRGPRALSERVVGAVLFVCGIVSILTTIGIVVVLVKESAGFFAEVSLGDFLGDTEWTPLFTEKHFGIWPLLAGTMLTTAIAVLVALPAVAFRSLVSLPAGADLAVVASGYLLLFGLVATLAGAIRRADWAFVGRWLSMRQLVEKVDPAGPVGGPGGG